MENREPTALHFRRASASDAEAIVALTESAYRGDASRAITLYGVDPEAYFRIVALPDKIVHGSARLTSSDIVIGTELASDLGVGVGDKVRVTSAEGSNNVLTVSGANSTIQAVDAALSTVSAFQSQLGAIQNRFTAAVSNLTSTAQNLTQSRSTIQDANFAQETANLTQAQVLEQAGISVLSQANQEPQLILKLLQ